MTTKLGSVLTWALTLTVGLIVMILAQAAAVSLVGAAVSPVSALAYGLIAGTLTYASCTGELRLIYARSRRR